MKHYIRVWPRYFERVLDGSKTFEVQKNDQDFQMGDEVLLREFDPRKRGDFAFTGRELVFRIGFVFPICHETVVFSLVKP